jgi:deoxyadenosine/deoxycytidine kinase
MGPPASEDPFIAVAGNVATGKSGLVRNLADTLGVDPLLEDIAANPYFDQFYDDPSRWAFHSQVAFTADSLRRHVEAIGSGPVVQDRTVYETTDVFASMLHRLGHITSVDLRVLTEFRQCAQRLPRQPSLVIYLHAPVPVLAERIAIRDRHAERAVTHEYLSQLNECYEEFAREWTTCPMVRVDTAARDIRRPDELSRLYGELGI